MKRMKSSQNSRLLQWFVVYTIGVGILYSIIAVLLGSPYVPPEYWFLFLFVTPLLAAVALAAGIHTGRYSAWAVGLFILAALYYGIFLRELSPHFSLC